MGKWFLVFLAYCCDPEFQQHFHATKLFNNFSNVLPNQLCRKVLIADEKLSYIFYFSVHIATIATISTLGSISTKAAPT